MNVTFEVALQMIITPSLHDHNRRKEIQIKKETYIIFETEITVAFFGRHVFDHMTDHNMT